MLRVSNICPALPLPVDLREKARRATREEFLICGIEQHNKSKRMPQSACRVCWERMMEGIALVLLEACERKGYG